MTFKEKLTQLYKYLEDDKNWRLPPFSELCEYMSIKSKSEMFELMYQLKAKGLIKKVGNGYKLVR